MEDAETGIAVLKRVVGEVLTDKVASKHEFENSEGASHMNTERTVLQDEMNACDRGTSWLLSNSL